MAAVLSLAQVAGNHGPVYEAFYQLVDPAGTGSVGAMDAAKFLKKSGLSDTVLSKIWDLSDTNGQGFLDKKGFFVALKLVSLAQNNHDISIVNISLDIPPPNMGDPSASLGNMDWSMKPTEKAKYDQLFDSLFPVQGKLSSTKVKPIMMNSKLPVDVLGRVWDLSDLDRDGSLDRDEFALAMHLIYKALENHPVPTVLPLELIPAAKEKKIPPGAVQVLPSVLSGIDGTQLGQLSSPPLSTNTLSADVIAKNTQNKSGVPWIITAAEKAKYDIMFKNADLDGDGFVNGIEIKDVFLQSGLPQPVLAHIWALCDMKQTGRLNCEQFALAMYLIEQKLNGVELMATLPPEMIPPTMRPKPGLDGIPTESSGVTSGSNYSNSELDMISKEIEELAKEKRQLEQDVTQKEADIRIKNGEIKLLTGELTTLTATLKQLENQKGEAQKRLDDLDTQKTSLTKNLDDLRNQVEEEKEKVINLKKHMQEQEKTVQEQQTELNLKRQELNDLKVEENNLEQQIQMNKTKLDQLNKNLQETLLLISQAKAKMTHLQENQRQLNDTIVQFDSAISSGNVSSLSDSTLKLQLSYMEPEYSKLDNIGSSVSPGSSIGGLSATGSALEEDPFKSKDVFASVNGFATDPFSGQDPFKDDPFKPAVDGGNADAFGGIDPFKTAFSDSDPFKDADPFKDSDPFSSEFSSSVPTAAAKNDPFDPFGAGTFDKPSTVANMNSNGDLFGSDPFGPPPVAPRTESPTPALPPKKSKQPPPRPAPPRSGAMKVPRAAPPAPSPDPFASTLDPPLGGNGAEDAFTSGFGNDPFDPFSSSGGKDVFSGDAASSGSDGFANFADFNSKFSERNMSEEEQLAWATQESVRAEKDRQMKAAQKEQADLELALALSKAEAEKQT